MTEARAQGRLLKRDVIGSVVLGPLRVAIPTLGYLALYPLILKTSGPEVLGLWALLTLIPVLAATLDVGFSDLLRRDVDLELPSGKLVSLREDYDAARTAYLLIGSAIALGVFAGALVGLKISNVYSTQALAFAIVALVFGATLQLVARLDDAVLSARRDSLFVRLVDGVTPGVALGCAAVGVVHDRPLEGLGIGTVAASGMSLVALRWRLHRSHTPWVRAYAPGKLLHRLSRCRELMVAGRNYHVASLGMLLREPLFRVLLGIALGLAAVGVWDIGMRVTRVTRDLISAGFVVLLPAYASLTRRNERALLIRLMQSSLLAVVVPGAVLQTVLLLVADRALSMWLGEVPEGLLNVIGLLALWNFLTIVNVPFWYWLLATGHQREAAKSVWLHTVTLISLYPLGHLVELNVAMCAVVWTLGSVATQARIYYYIQSRSDFLKSVLSRFTCFMLLAGVGLLTSAAWWTNRSERSGTAQEQGVEVTIGTLTVVYLVVFLVYVAKSRFIDYLLPSRGVSV